MQKGLFTCLDNDLESLIPTYGDPEDDTEKIKLPVLKSVMLKICVIRLTAKGGDHCTTYIIDESG
jgi:hypothetical protein